MCRRNASPFDGEVPQVVAVWLGAGARLPCRLARLPLAGADEARLVRDDDRLGAASQVEHQPRATAWLLALCIPLMIVASGVLGHNGLGLVPLLLALAATGWQLWQADAPALHEPAIATTG